MNRLSDICGSGRGASSTLTELRASCHDTGQALGLTSVEAVLLVLLAVTAFVWVMAARNKPGASRWSVLGGAVEGAAYAAIGFWAGSSFGLRVAEVVPPHLLGTLVAVVAVVCVVFGVLGAVNGTAGGGGKALGVLEASLLGLVLFTLAIFGWRVPGSGPAGDAYEAHLNAVALGLGVLGATDALFAALLRAYGRPWGWALVAVNSSWGFVGNCLGLATHAASYNCYAGHGGANASPRIAYVRYASGLSLKPGYAFTQGAVMSSQGGDYEKHEAIHVAQHYVLGPIYPVSHGIWAAGAGIFGLVAAAIRGKSIGQGIEACSYYDNPYEIVAYTFFLNGRNPADDFVFGSPWSGIVAIGWIALAVVAFVVLTAAWTP